MLPDVGEGQDLSVIYRPALSNGAFPSIRYRWDDGCSLELAAGGNQFLTRLGNLLSLDFAASVGLPTVRSPFVVGDTADLADERLIDTRGRRRTPPSTHAP